VTVSSKLHPKFQSGVVVISGLWGLGKSTLAFTAERPG
jgi:adenylylsulfate kinase-like enzyme